MVTPTSFPLPGQSSTSVPQVVNAGGLRAVPLAVVQAEQAAEQALRDDTQAPAIATGIAGHIQKCFTMAQQAKRNTIDDRLYNAIRSRRGEYDPSKLAEIKDLGGSQVWAGITGAKCRAAGSWLRDILLGTGSERPWAVDPTPVPDLPPDVNEYIVEQAMQPIQQALQSGFVPPQEAVVQMMSTLRDQAMSEIRDEARKRADRMAEKMEDQLIEGGFRPAIDAFIDDVCTYPTAFMKGPVVRKRPVLTWGPDGQPVVESRLTKSWERVSPFNIYPMPGAEDIQDGWLLERHRLSRQDLNEMIGVEGYSDTEIKACLSEYQNGLTRWFYELVQQHEAEGHDTSASWQNPDGLIDALQFWGSVPGELLKDWGMEDISDPTQEYHVEAWLIGSHVIRAVLNYDPLCRKPYYAASYERVPGNVWGNSIPDLVKDPQDIANATARALVNNMALASGPQVGVLVDRLASGEDITQLSPWRIWQLKSNPLGGSTTERPIDFFQPQSNANELLQVFERFSQMADEYSGIPRYLTGDTTGGAGRTASGLSMLINNAGKSIKQVISNIDNGLMQPLLDRLYYHNMRYEADPDLKGDVKIVARGASALVAKETAQVRRQEFLAATANPIDMQITGIEGRAAVLREVAQSLDMNADRVVPPNDVLRQKLMAAAALAGGAPSPEKGPTPVNAAGGPSDSGQSTMDGAPITDNFSPPRAA